MDNREIIQFLPCKVIKIGVYKNLNTLIRAMEKFKLDDSAKDILGNPTFTLAQTEEDIPLCEATVKELTEKDQATTMEVFAAIKLVGYLCPSEVGPALRAQDFDQLKWRRVAMEPIKGSDGVLRGFEVGHNGPRLWLCTYDANPNHLWPGVHHFVFRARKQILSEVA